MTKRSKHLGLAIPTAEEDAAIASGIAADPDAAPELDDAFFERAKLFDAQRGQQRFDGSEVAGTGKAIFRCYDVIPQVDDAFFFLLDFRGKPEVVERGRGVKNRRANFVVFYCKYRLNQHPVERSLYEVVIPHDAVRGAVWNRTRTF